MTTARTAFRFLDHLRVRWAEVDMQRIVFNGHYLMYFDTAVAGYWRALALPYHETMEQLQGDLYVRKATLEYEGSARYDDLIDVGIRCARIGNSSMVFEAAVFRGPDRLVHGELLYVFADPATQTSRPVPQALREVLLGFEAGEPVLEVRTGTWGELGSRARALRQAVLVDELKAPPEMADDETDPHALHAVALNRFGVAIAAARLVEEGAPSGRLGRMVVMAGLRGSGIGRALMQVLLDAARRRGLGELVLDAQLEAVPFYRRMGFVERGARFEVHGIDHQPMAMAL